MRKLLICSLSLAVLLGGCVLDPIPDYGEKCPPDGASGRVYGEYLDGTGFCAKNQLCIPVGTTDDFICTTQCGTEEANKPEDPAICANKCIESFHDLNIDICELEDDIPLCAKGYADCDRRISTGCEADLSSMQHCGACDSECSENAVPNSRTVECKNSKCRAKDCQNHYHLMADGSCAEDTDAACTDLETGEVIDCKTANHAADGECQSGKCRIIACKSGFHLSGEGAGNLCVENTDFECGNELVDCSNIPNAVTASCDKPQGYCEVSQCVPDYHPADHACERDSVEACGITLTQCTAPEHGIPDCFAGICDFSCEPGYHLSEDLCEEDSNFHCGEHENTCDVDKIKNSAEVACIEGTCVATKCNAGYHLYNGTCEANSIKNCGEHGSQCPNSHCESSLIANSANYENDDIICISGNLTVGPVVETLKMGQLIYSGGIDMNFTDKGGNLTSVSLPKLLKLGKEATYMNGTGEGNVWSCSIVLRNANHLKSLTLNNLLKVEGELYFDKLDIFSTLNMKKLTYIRNALFNAMPKMKKFNFSSCTQIGAAFYLNSQGKLSEFSLPALTKANSISIKNNPNLENLNFNDATINKLEIYNNPMLSCTNMCSLKNYTQLNTRGITDNSESSCDLKSTCP